MTDPRDYNRRLVNSGDVSEVMLEFMVQLTQKELGLKVDGKCGGETRVAIRERILKGCPEPDSNLPLALRALEFARREIGRGEDPTLGNNRGKAVDEYRAIAGLPEGGSDAWCAAFICAMFCKANGGKAPFQVSAGAKRLAKNAAIVGQETIVPLPGALICWHRGMAVDWRGHIGLIEAYNAESDTLTTIEGNRSVGREPAKVARFGYPSGKWRERLYKIVIV